MGHTVESIRSREGTLPPTYSWLGRTAHHRSATCRRTQMMEQLLVLRLARISEEAHVVPVLPEFFTGMVRLLVGEDFGEKSVCEWRTSGLS